MQHKSEPAGILLAAGRSRRFGGDKLLHPLADGTPMVLASIEALRAVLPRVVAVVRADNTALTEFLASHHIEAVVAEQADAGMGASLAAGVAATADACGWLIALGDMPFIQPHTVARVVNELQCGARLAAPCYQGRRGHPVGFSASYREPLLKLSGDEGARNLLQHNAGELVLVECGDPGVLKDIDQR